MEKYKDKLYELTGRHQPIINKIPSRHTRKNPLMWFDEEKGYNRELRYGTNQKSPFADEQQGYVTLGHIFFKNGRLNVPKTKPALQKLLSLYHPKKDILYTEYQPEIIAEDQVDRIELEFEALALAKQLNVDEMEAILRVELGNKVSKMSSKEIKRDALLFAKGDPVNFIKLGTDDNVQLRNIGVKAVEAGIIKLTNDRRAFNWKNGRKLFTVPFDEHPYSALASWFKTDDGLEILQAIEKKLK